LYLLPRFLTEDDHETVRNAIASHNYALHFCYYGYSGEEAPVMIEDFEDPPESESEDESDEDESEGGEGHLDIPDLD
jgi:hypothetical protein